MAAALGTICAHKVKSVSYLVLYQKKKKKKEIANFWSFLKMEYDPKRVSEFPVINSFWEILEKSIEYLFSDDIAIIQTLEHNWRNNLWSPFNHKIL